MIHRYVTLWGFYALFCYRELAQDFEQSRQPALSGTNDHPWPGDWHQTVAPGEKPWARRPAWRGPQQQDGVRDLPHTPSGHEGIHTRFKSGTVQCILRFLCYIYNLNLPYRPIYRYIITVSFIRTSIHTYIHTYTETCITVNKASIHPVHYIFVSIRHSSIYSPISIHQFSIYLSIQPTIYLSIHRLKLYIHTSNLSIQSFICLSIQYSSIHVVTHLFICLSNQPSSHSYNHTSGQPSIHPTVQHF